MKISIIGCGLRTPLLLSGLMRTGRLPDEIALFDLDSRQASLMAALGRAASPESPSLLRVAANAEDAIADSDFVICSIRPGGIEARARDERTAVKMGFAGQETIGPAGAAMAWRTIPAVLEYARLIEKLAPNSWLINFTNPAGLVTQAIHQHSGIKAVGICDTPAELFYRIALSFGVPPKVVSCDYFGLNHLGFVRRVEVHGQDRTRELLADDERLQSLYPAPLFPPALLRQIGLIPTEYAFFYYRPSLALANQVKVGKTRGEELLEMNHNFYSDVADATEREGGEGGLRVYARYLNHRNASYLQLEGGGASAFAEEAPDWDPFEAVTGYHRIAVQTIQALCGASPVAIVLNVPNQGALPELEPDDIVEINCHVDGSGITRLGQGSIPSSVRGLLESTKAYERSLVRAALAQDKGQLIGALTQHPLIRDWDSASALVTALP